MKCWANTGCRPGTSPPSIAPIHPTPTSAPRAEVFTRTPVEGNTGSLTGETGSPAGGTGSPTDETLSPGTVSPSDGTASPAGEFFSIAPSIRSPLTTEAPISEPMELTNAPSNTPTQQTFAMTELPSSKQIESTNALTNIPTQQVSTMHPSTSPITEIPASSSILEAVVERNPAPTELTTYPPQHALPPSTVSVPAPSQEMIASVGSILAAAESGITNDILVQFDIVTKEQTPTKLYHYDGFMNALGVISKGDIGSTYFYLGPTGDSGPAYGLINVALFLAQAAVESVHFGVCDEVSWEKDVFERYPLSNACGQGGRLIEGSAPYEDSNPCSDDEAFMACGVDAEMSAAAETHGIFEGAPPPLECFPSTTQSTTGAWDPSLSCVESGCTSYIGQSMGNVDPLSIPAKNTVSSDCCTLHYLFTHLVPYGSL